MVGELIMLPVRIGVRATQLWLRVAEETVSVTASAAGHLIGAASRGSGGGSGTSAPTEQQAPSASDGNGRSAIRDRDESSIDQGEIEREVSAALRRPAEDAAPPPLAATSSLEAPDEPEPVHVSEEPALVEELAEPGAEDGAGAQVRIDPPWEGYERMNAKQVVDRLSSATPAELAAVQLFEGSHRKRQTIVNAVQRQLRSANGRSTGRSQ
jgi:hypothetical protein